MASRSGIVGRTWRRVPQGERVLVLGLAAVLLAIVLLLLPTFVRDFVQSGQDIRCNDQNDECDPFAALGADLAALVTVLVELALVAAAVGVYVHRRRSRRRDRV